ncbi:MAG: DUF695 domain-containing protein [Bacteroidales bacterium]|nr:DUF695 domain-containing protein [Bacteroidales bacterium]
MRKYLITLLITILISYSSKSQDGNRDFYIVQYDAGAGSTLLNMDLINSAPKKDLPFIVITGVTFKNCRDDGFPNEDELKKLYKIDDEVESVISNITNSEFAGTFTYQCERLNYIYVSDTINIRAKLTDLYKKYKHYKFYINIEPDRKWETYLNFLYPDEEIQEYMSNQKILVQLQSAGDDLSKERQVDHWIYFPDKSKMELFIIDVKKIGFKIESQDKINDSGLLYQLHISRIDFIDMESISKLSLNIRRKAKKLGGDYDGWETFVIK